MMKKTILFFCGCAVVMGGSAFAASAAGRLVGGRGVAVSPELVSPAFPYDDAKRSPFLSPGVMEATVTAAAAVGGGDLSADEVMAGVTVQAVFLVLGEPQALLNNQSAKAGQNIKLLIRGKTATLKVLEVNRNENSVRLNYKGAEFVRAMGGNKIRKP